MQAIYYMQLYLVLCGLRITISSLASQSSVLSKFFLAHQFLRTHALYPRRGTGNSCLGRVFMVEEVSLYLRCSQLAARYDGGEIRREA